MRSQILLLFIATHLMCSQRIWADDLNTDIRLFLGKHTGLISRISVDSSENHLLSAATDGSAILWDAHSGERRSVFFSPIKGSSGEQFFACALSPDASVAAVGGFSNESSSHVYLFNPFSQKEISKLGPFQYPVSDLLFSPDGKLLITSFYDGGGLIFSTGDWEPVAALNQRKTIYNAAVQNQTGIATAGGDGTIEIYSRQSFAAQTIFRSNQVPYSIAISPKNSSIAVGYSGVSGFRIIDLLTGEDNFFIQKGGKNNQMSIVDWLSDNYLIAATGSLSSRTSQVMLTLQHRYMGKDGAKTVGVVGRGAPTDMVVTRSKDIITATTNSELSRVDTSGNVKFHHFSPAAVVTDNIRMTANADAVYISLDNRWIPLKLSLAQSPRLFSGDVARKDVDFHNSISFKTKPIHLIPDHKSAPLIAILHRNKILINDTAGRIIRTINTPSGIHNFAYAPATKQIVTYHNDNVFRWYRIADGQLSLSAYLSNDAESFLAWTPSGYWSGNQNGKTQLNLLIQTVQRDLPLEYRLKYLPVSTFSPERVAAATAGRLFSSEELHKALTPHIRIHAPQTVHSFSDSVIDIEINLWSPDVCLTSEITVKVNGKESPAVLRGLNLIGDNEKSYHYRIKLIRGNNTIKAAAGNCNGTGEVKTASVTFEPRKKSFVHSYEIAPRLHIMSVGVSLYKNSTFDLSYAANDARDFVMTAASGHPELYSDLKLRVYTDSAAQRDSILEALRQLSRDARSSDVSMVFFAGHGYTDSYGKFYFLPHEGSPDRLLSTAISDDDLETALSRIPGKVICFLDACNAGSLLPKRRSLSTPAASLISRINQAGPGVVLFSSSMPNQYSEELSRYKNGAFSTAVIEGLSGAADFYGGGYVTVNMLEAYISQRVKELTDGRQTPVTTKPPGMADYPIAIIR